MTTVEQVEDQDEVLTNLGTVDAVEPPVTPSVRESLAAAIEQNKSKESEEEKPKSGRERDDAGKFTKGQKEQATKDTVSRETQVSKVAPELPEIKMPKSFPAEKAKDFAALPRPIQELLAKREEDYHKELTKHDEERQFGRTISQMASPYLPLMKAEGADVTKSFEQFLNTAYILRTKSPQEKGQLILKLAQEFGADLRGATQQAQQPFNPVLHQLQQEIAGLKGQLERETTLKKQQEDSSLKSQIDVFAADPKNVHFETVKAHMAALLRGGIAKDLQDAYEQAVYANPHTRSTLLEANVKSVEEQRVADKKAKAEAAKKAGSSIRGAPGMGAVKNGLIAQPDLRKAITSAFAEHRGEA